MLFSPRLRVIVDGARQTRRQSAQRCPQRVQAGRCEQRLGTSARREKQREAKAGRGCALDIPFALTLRSSPRPRSRLRLRLRRRSLSRLRLRRLSLRGVQRRGRRQGRELSLKNEASAWTAALGGKAPHRSRLRLRERRFLYRPKRILRRSLLMGFRCCGSGGEGRRAQKHTSTRERGGGLMPRARAPRKTRALAPARAP